MKYQTTSLKNNMVQTTTEHNMNDLLEVNNEEVVKAFLANKL